jgi:hypothetical protein
LKPEKEIENAVKSYISARKRILQIAAKYPNLLGGNDNIIGRIGEYYAILFLCNKGQSPEKTSGNNQMGYDLVDKKTMIKTQVKIIGPENRSGRNVRLKEPWDQFVLIQLNKNYEPEKIGLLLHADYLKAIREVKNMKKDPIVKKTMLGRKGLLARYGTVEAI